MSLLTNATSIDVTPIKPGDVVIDDIVIRSYNGFSMSLRGIFQTFVIYEDIHSNFMSGSITLVDSTNLVKNLPIIGSEVLIVSFRTPVYSSKSRRHVFRTFKLSRVTDTAQETTQLVKIEFVSHGAIKSMQRKVSKSFENMTVSEMVKNIYDEYISKDTLENNGSLNSQFDSDVRLKNDAPLGISSIEKQRGMSTLSGNIDTALSLTRNSPERQGIFSDNSVQLAENSDGKQKISTIAETFDKRTYVIPYMNPFEAINWLCSRSRSRFDTTQCDYVFFENADGHHFVPLSQLKTAPTKCVYTKVPKGFRSQSGERLLDSEMRNVLSVTIDDLTDKVKEQAMGMLASSMITHDMTTKTWNSFQYTYNTSVGTQIEKYPIVPDNVDYRFAVESCNSVVSRSRFTTSGIVSNNDPEEIVLLRRSQMVQMQAINLTLECYGDSELHVGDVIEYNPIAKESTKFLDSYLDDYYRGRYLVTAIRHRITDREHYMTMTVSRDSYAEPLATKKNPELKAQS